MTYRSVATAVAVALLVLSAAAVPAAANPYFADLSPLVGTNSTGGYYTAYPTGINDSGAVLLQGENSAYSTANYTTYLYTGGSLINITAQELGNPASRVICRNTAMNSNGQIAIGTGAFLSTISCIPAALPGPPRRCRHYRARPLSILTGLTTRGTFAARLPLFGGHRPAAPSTLGAPSMRSICRHPRTLAEAEAMSPNGAYTVGQWNWYYPGGSGGPPGIPGQYACLWTRKSGSWTNGGSFSDISGAIYTAITGLSGGYQASLALAVNNSGQVLCTVGATVGPGAGEGYVSTGVNAALYNATNGSATILPTSFMIGQATNATLDDLTLDAGMTQMINDNGQIVGYEVVGGVNHAAVWQNGTATDLNTVYGSLLPAGFILNDAMAIDDNGDIAGFGTDSAGNTVQAFVLRAFLPGDANLDGKVDINDLTIVLAHYGQGGATWATGDFIGDGTVDINDLTIVLAHYSHTVGASAADALAAVPEPAALTLLLAAVLLGGARLHPAETVGLRLAPGSEPGWGDRHAVAPTAPRVRSLWHIFRGEETLNEFAPGDTGSCRRAARAFCGPNPGDRQSLLY